MGAQWVGSRYYRTYISSFCNQKLPKYIFRQGDISSPCGQIHLALQTHANPKPKRIHKPPGCNCGGGRYSTSHKYLQDCCCRLCVFFLLIGPNLFQVMGPRNIHLLILKASWVGLFDAFDLISNIWSLIWSFDTIDLFCKHSHTILSAGLYFWFIPLFRFQEKFPWFSSLLLSPNFAHIFKIIQQPYSLWEYPEPLFCAIPLIPLYTNLVAALQLTVAELNVAKFDEVFSTRAPEGTITADRMSSLLVSAGAPGTIHRPSYMCIKTISVSFFILTAPFGACNG